MFYWCKVISTITTAVFVLPKIKKEIMFDSLPGMRTTGRQLELPENIKRGSRPP